MRLLLHDFGGYAFIVPLSRALAGRGHEVVHAYCGSVQTPQGLLERREQDPPGLSFRPLRLAEQIRKQSFVRRWKQERRYADLLLELLRETQPDVVLSADTPSQIQAKLVAQCRRDGVRFVSWVQDLYGQAAYDILSKKIPVLGGHVGRHYMRLDDRCLRQSDGIVLITEAFRDVTRGCGVEDARTEVIPNWAPLHELPPCPKVNAWSRRHDLHDKLCFVYSGTLSMKHNPDLLLRLAQAFRGRAEVRVVVVSEGAGADWLRDNAGSRGLTNLLVLPFQAFDDLPMVLGSADVLVSVLEPEAGRFSVPSKVLTYLCAKRPLLLGVPAGNLAAATVAGAGAGLVTPPADVGAFLSAAVCLAGDERLRRRMAENGRRYAEDHFDAEAIADRFGEVLHRATGQVAWLAPRQTAATRRAA